MHVFATYADLKRLGQGYETATLRKSADSSAANKDTFLSHSSKDNEWLPGVVAVLEGNGANVYVDNADESLPENTSVETAQILRKNLALTKKFVLFVTPNSETSIWIPWELGIADGEKRSVNVALFPAAEKKHERRWSEREYFGLYRRIVWANFEGEEPQWLVLEHHQNTATTLSGWLRS